MCRKFESGSMCQKVLDPGMREFGFLMRFLF